MLHRQLKKKCLHYCQNPLLSGAFHSKNFALFLSEDRYSPKPVSVNELVVTEGGKTTITTEFLSFTDDDTEPASLTYLVLQPPQLGHLQLSNEPGMFTDF